MYGRGRIVIKGLVSQGHCYDCQRECHPARGSLKDRPWPQDTFKAAVKFNLQPHLLTTFRSMSGNSE